MKILKTLPIVELPAVASVCKQWHTFYKNQYDSDSRLNLYETESNRIYSNKVCYQTLTISLTAIGVFNLVTFGVFRSMEDGLNECLPCYYYNAIIGLAGLSGIVTGSFACRNYTRSRENFERLKHQFDEI